MSVLTDPDSIPATEQVAAAIDRAPAESDYAVSPGEYLAEWIENKKLSPSAVAQLTGLGKDLVMGILFGRVPVTRDVAIQLERVAGIPVNTWLRMEETYRRDLIRINRSASDELAGLVEDVRTLTKDLADEANERLRFSDAYDQVRGERDGALAVIERLRPMHVKQERPRIEDCSCGSLVVCEVRVALATAPADALDTVKQAAAVTALETARDQMMPPLNWNLDPRTGAEQPGTSHVDAVYADVHREMTEIIDATRNPVVGGPSDV